MLFLFNFSFQSTEFEEEIISTETKFQRFRVFGSEAANDDVYGGTHAQRGSWACNAERIGFGFGVAVFGNGFVKRTEKTEREKDKERGKLTHYTYYAE